MVAVVDPGVVVVSHEVVSLEVAKAQVLQEAPGDPSIQISRQESGQGATCTENSGEEHISVLNLGHAPGKTYLQQNHQTNEPVTNLATLTFIHL